MKCFKKLMVHVEQQRSIKSIFRKIRRSRKRDHRKLGKGMDLSISERVLAVQFFARQGLDIISRLVEYMRFRKDWPDTKRLIPRVTR